MEKEVWKDIPGYEKYYMASTHGRIKSKDRIINRFWGSFVREGKIMKQKSNHNGYSTIQLTKNGKQKRYMVHRLVAMAFISNPRDLPFINHKDEIRTNNCVSNLEWCTQSYNVSYGNCITKRQVTQRNTNKNMKPVIAYNDENKLEFISIRGAARELNLHQSNIQQAIKNNTKCGNYYWKYK